MKLRAAAIYVSFILISAWPGASGAGAQTEPAPSPAPRATANRQAAIAAQGAFFALSVADLEASTRWYSEKLGLEVILSVPKANGVAVTVLGGGGLTVELIQQDSAAAPGCGTANPMCLGLFKAGVLVKDLDKTLKALAARGVSPAFGPFPEQPNQPANAIIRDNAGNLIQIIKE